MPRKKSLNAEDPIYSINRWGGQKKPEAAPEIPEQTVRSGRIKKAKTIFDPSDTWITGRSSGADGDAAEKKPEKGRSSDLEKKVEKQQQPQRPSETEKKRPEKRRLSESTTLSRGSSFGDVIAKPNDHKKRIKVETPTLSLIKKPPPTIKPPKPVEENTNGRPPRPSKAREPVTGDEPLAFHFCKMCMSTILDTSKEWTKCGICLDMVHKPCHEHTKYRSRYLCSKCNICVVCCAPLLTQENTGADTMMCCGSDCRNSCHYLCAAQNGTKSRTPSRKWRCNNCNEVEILPLDDSSDDSEAAFEGFENNGMEEENKEPSAYDKLVPNGEIPDAANWTSKDVYNFFVKQFPDEAPNFQQQEIDGMSLLLMRRSDVIRGMGFRLGPALRIYKQIVMLQTKDPDPTLTWF